MKVGILICDNVQPHLQQEFGDYRLMFTNLLAQVDEQLELVFYDTHRQQLPIDIDECDGYLTSGSRYSVYDDLLWIAQLEDFIRQLYQASKPFVGICFGHQLLAKALGGEVTKSSKGWGVGLNLCQVGLAQPWMLPAKENLALVVSHQDQISRLPPAAEVLAGNDFCPVSMFQVGQTMLGLQGHPEFSRAYSAALMDSRKDRIGATLITSAKRTLQHNSDDLFTMVWLVNFLKQTPH